MPSLSEALGEATRALSLAGVPEPRREAQVLVGHALGATRAMVLGHPERELSPAEDAALGALLARRKARVPTAYLLGEREFWSLPLRVSPDTLIPRPDSETVVELALASLRDRSAPCSVLDLGTGSGCLLLALLSELRNAWGVGVDLSARALTVARDNAARLGYAERARFVCGDWGGAVVGRFDLIVVNPPYVGAEAFAALAPEVAACEPRLALLSGADALACYRAVAPDVARLMAPGATAVVEVGAGQADGVAAIVADNGLVEAARRRDLGGVERCLALRRR